MIEKLPFTEIHSGGADMVDRVEFRPVSLYDIQYKINELCDIINTIQKEREAEWFEIKEWIGILEAVRKSVNVHEKQIDELQMKVEPEKCEVPVDPYAEQHQWIGKLCKFWNDEDEGYIYEILIDIDGSDYPYKIVDVDSKNWTMSYKHCEPVPEDLIYKVE